MTIQPEPPRPEPAVAPATPQVDVIGQTPRAVSSDDPAIRGGASWLLWIAGLSLVNVALTAGGSDMSFAIGLVVSQLIAIVGVGIGNQAGMPAIGWIGAVIAAVPALLFGALWFPAKQGKRWVFMLGMVAYGIDLAILLAIVALAGEMDIIGIGIHAWALWALWRGWSATQPSA